MTSSNTTRPGMGAEIDPGKIESEREFTVD